MQGLVLVNDRPHSKPGERPPLSAILRVKGGPPRQFVSRGGDKLIGALTDLKLTVTGLRCLDVGAATGGFSDCLLQAGAAESCCVDVGYGLLADRLRRDPRVTVRERTNARLLQPADLPWPPDLIVVDASFIGARALLPALSAVAAPQGLLLIMVKPQFELPAAEVGLGGVVRDDDARLRAAASVAVAAAELGWQVRGQADSQVAGPQGNREIFLLLDRSDKDV